MVSPIADRDVAAAKALFLHNTADHTDPQTAEAAWLLDEDVRAFWLTQARVAAEALGVVRP